MIIPAEQIDNYHPKQGTSIFGCFDFIHICTYDISKEVVTLVKMVPSLSPVSYWWNTMVTASLSSEVSSSTAVLPPARRRPSFLPKLFCSMWAGPEGGGGVGAGSSTTLILA